MYNWSIYFTTSQSFHIMDRLASFTSTILNCSAFWMEAYVCTHSWLVPHLVLIYMDALKSQNKVQQITNYCIFLNMESERLDKKL